MATWITGTSEANGMTIHYLRTGGNKPPLVMLHGLMTSGACWTPLARELENDYDVIMPDARGHGNSSSPIHGYSYHTLAADVLSFIDALNLSSPILLGHSMGGMTAVVAANQNPKQLGGLVLVDPAFLTFQQQREVQESDIIAQHRRILNQPKEDFLAIKRKQHSQRSPELIELMVQARYQTSLNAFAVLTPPYPDHTQLISSLTIPCLLVIGGNRAVVSPAMAADFAAHNQLMEVVQISEAGHGIPYDHPKRLASLIKPF